MQFIFNFNHVSTCDSHDTCTNAVMAEISSSIQLLKTYVNLSKNFESNCIYFLQLVRITSE